MIRAGETTIEVAGDVIPILTATLTDFMTHFEVTMLNPKVILGLLIGAMMAFLFCGLTINAKQYVEVGYVGGKGSAAHKATVTGDTVGDPFKDTAGPSLHILIKLMSMVAIVTAGINVAYTLF